MAQTPTSPRMAERHQEKVLLKDLNDRFEKVLNEVRVANFHLGKEVDQLTFDAEAFAALHRLRNEQGETLKARQLAEQRDIGKLNEEKQAQEKKSKDKEAELIKAEKQGDLRLGKLKEEIRAISKQVVDKELDLEQLRYNYKRMKDRSDHLDADIAHFNSKKFEFEGNTAISVKEYDDLQQILIAIKADNLRIEDALGRYKNEEYYTSFEKEFYRRLDAYEAEQAAIFENALDVERQRLHAEYNSKSLHIKNDKDREAEIAERFKLKQTLEERISVMTKTIASLRFDVKQLKQGADDKGKEMLRLLKDLFKKEYKEINEVLISSELAALERSLEADFLALDAEVYDEGVRHAQLRSERQAELDRLLELERQMEMNRKCDVPLTAELHEYEVMLKKMETTIHKLPGKLLFHQSVQTRTTIEPTAGPSHVSVTVSKQVTQSTPQKSGEAVAHSPELIPHKPQPAPGEKRKRINQDTPRK